MKLIAHRGNLSGPNPSKENDPKYIIEAINKGYDCEIDVRLINEELFLGHDNPDYQINLIFLLDNSDKLWIHCKNLESFSYLIEFKDLNIFWHQEDSYTLTSKHFIWSFPTTPTTNKCIILMPEWNDFKINDNYYGICTDYVINFI
jgi:hypothetical protein